MMAALFSAQGRFAIPPTHPAFAGHFPGQPMLPGVVLLDLIQAEADLAAHGLILTGIAQVKFLRPVRPGEVVTFALAEQTGRRLAIVAATQAGPVLRGQLLLGDRARP